MWEVVSGSAFATGQRREGKGADIPAWSVSPPGSARLPALYHGHLRLASVLIVSILLCMIMRIV